MSKVHPGEVERGEDLDLDLDLGEYVERTAVNTLLSATIRGQSKQLQRFDGDLLAQEREEEATSGAVNAALSNIYPPPLVGYSLGYIPADAKFRKYLYRFLFHPYFDKFIIFAIVINCLTMIWQTPLLDGETRDSFEAVLMHIDNSISMIFAVETVLKSITLGFICGPDTYLRSSKWNVLDFFVVLTSIMGQLPGLNDMAGFGAFRALRGLRVLRGIRFFTEIRAILDSFLVAAPLLVNVVGLILFLFMTLSILGFELYHGSLYARCVLNLTEFNAGSELVGPGRWGRYTDAELLGFFDTNGDSNITIDELVTNPKNAVEGARLSKNIGGAAASKKHFLSRRQI